MGILSVSFLLKNWEFVLNVNIMFKFRIYAHSFPMFSEIYPENKMYNVPTLTDLMGAH